MLIDYINTALLALLVTVGGAAVTFAYKTSGLLQKVLVIIASLQRRDDEQAEEIKGLRSDHSALKADVGFIKGSLYGSQKQEDDQ